MKRVWRQSALGVLALLVVLAFGFRLAEKSARAQDTQSVPAAAGQPAAEHDAADADDAYRKSPSVRKIGSLVGLNAEQSATAFEITNFLVLAIFLGWIVARVLPKALRNRTQAIQRHLVEARVATEEAKARLSGVEERLSRLDGEIAAMRAHAEEELAREEQRVKALAEEERKKILASAEQEIAAATLHAQKQLQQHAAELAIEQAARKLVVSAETDRLLVQGFAERLTGDESKKGQN